MRWVACQGRLPTRVPHILHPAQLIECVEGGIPLLVEALPEDVSPALEPLLARVTHTRSGVPYVRLGDVDVAWHPSFRLYLQTRLTNPNYRPEVAAQAVVVDFSVTRDGLEDQARTCGSGGGGGGGGG